MTAWSGCNIVFLSIFLFFKANRANVFFFFFFFFFLFFFLRVCKLITNASNDAMAPRQRAQFEVTGTGNRDETRDEVSIIAIVAIVAIIVAATNTLNRCHENRCPFMQIINVIKKYSIYIFQIKSHTSKGYK